MASIITLPGIEAAFSCAPGGVQRYGTGLPGALVARPAVHATRVVRHERLVPAPVVVAATPRAVDAAAAVAANDAGSETQTFGQKKTQRHMWALRGLDPWSDPA
ncbi:hypothetical protein ACTWP5_26770 [Streptomyces sp. 4N509B]|uniref:hypothetical protein n=1 Tax=Streptomyces sp. 4N509B TaxID=3457413 RepID=UPI003FD5B92A